MKQMILATIVALVIGGQAYCQESEPPTPAVREMALPKKTPLQLAVLDAVKSARKKGDMTARQAMAIRVAMLSPAFRDRVEDLAVTQMAFAATDDPLPRTTDGKVDRTAIDWKNLLAFLEKLLPFILELLDLFAVAGVEMEAVA